MDTGFLFCIYTSPPPKSRQSMEPIKHYHLFPTRNFSQEEWTSWIKKTPGMNISLVPQRDGSRMKFMAAARWEGGSAVSLSRILEENRTGLTVVPMGDEDSAFVAYEKMAINSSQREDLWFYIIRIHQFENGVRILPILWDRRLGMCFNVQSFWPDLEIEDGFGLLSPFKDQMPVGWIHGWLTTVPAENKRVVDYFPNIRICQSCKRPHDISVDPPKRVWVNAGWKKLETNYLPKRNH